MPIKIRFNKPYLSGREIGYITNAIRWGHASADGVYTQKCQEFFERVLNVPKALLMTSCTHALETCALLLDVKPGDEVIVPSFTFVSTVNAFVLRGAQPVFIDIRRDTLNLDESQIEKFISMRTKAIVPVHYAGVGCEMDTILSLAKRYNLAVVEDNAHGLFGKYKEKYLGTFGSLATLSFHETKNITCGEGGALLINDEQYIERAEIIRQKGTDRNRFLRGQVDKYTWVDLGSSYSPSDLLAAYLYAQLEAYESIQNKRRQVWSYYYEHLHEWAQEHEVELPFVPRHCAQSFHMFYLIMPSPELQQRLIAHLRERGIVGVFHYVPLHLSKMGRMHGGKKGDCRVTEEISGRLLRLPFYNDITEAELHCVVSTIKEFNRWYTNRQKLYLTTTKPLKASIPSNLQTC